MHRCALNTVLAVAVTVVAGGRLGAVVTPIAFGGEATVSPGISQYVEQVPTASGSVPSASAPTHTSKVPKRVQQRIASSGGSDSASLELIAQHARFGHSPYGPPAVDSVAAAARAPTETVSGSRLVGLVVVLVAATIAAVLGLPGARRSRSSSRLRVSLDHEWREMDLDG